MLGNLFHNKPHRITHSPSRCGENPVELTSRKFIFPDFSPLWKEKDRTSGKLNEYDWRKAKVLASHWLFLQYFVCFFSNEKKFFKNVGFFYFGNRKKNFFKLHLWRHIQYAVVIAFAFINANFFPLISTLKLFISRWRLFLIFISSVITLSNF